MTKVLHTCEFAGCDDTSQDEKITISYLKSGGVIICIHKGDGIIFDATIQKESWGEMLKTFQGFP